MRSARAEAYAAAASGTASLSALATVHGGILHTSDSFTRNGEGAAADFPEAARQVAFALEAGATSGAEELGGGYVVVTLDEVIPADEPTSDDLAAGRTALGGALGADVVNSFIASLWDRAPSAHRTRRCWTGSSPTAPARRTKGEPPACRFSPRAARSGSRTTQALRRSSGAP